MERSTARRRHGRKDVGRISTTRKISNRAQRGGTALPYSSRFGRGQLWRGWLHLGSQEGPRPHAVAAAAGTTGSSASGWPPFSPWWHWSFRSLVFYRPRRRRGRRTLRW